jgi:Uma2 family endonuclease
MTRTIDEILAGPLDRHAVGQLGERSEYRWEISEEGVVTIMTPPRLRHGMTVSAIRDWLRDGGLPGRLMIAEAGLAAGSHAGRVPDLVVLSDAADGLDPQTVWIPPDVVCVVVEVESPGTEIADRTAKHREYAAASIGTYWRVSFDDADVAWVHVYWLHEGTYVERRLEPLAEALAGKPDDYIRS